MTVSTPLGRALAARVKPFLPYHDVPHETEGDTPAATRAAAESAMAAHRCDHYTRRPGIAPLCRQVAARLAAVGLTVDPDDGVVISGGAAEARFVTLRALGAGNTIHVPQGTRDLYRIATVAPDASLVEYTGDTPFAATPGIWIWRADGAPTVDAVAENAVVVADMLDAPQAVPGELAALATSAGVAAKLLVLGGFGTAAGLDAWNVAWFAGPNPLVAKVRGLKQAMTICTPAPGQYAALAALEGGAA
jgi:aspartate/methionine/tyrosine aminotransferase